MQICTFLWNGKLRQSKKIINILDNENLSVSTLCARLHIFKKEFLLNIMKINIRINREENAVVVDHALSFQFLASIQGQLSKLCPNAVPRVSIHSVHACNRISFLFDDDDSAGLNFSVVI